jgi:serine/threonine protein kinase
MGTVWRGWDERLRRTVAVKEVTIPPGLPDAEADRLRERYLREARAAARLRHPAVVGVYDVIQESGQVWIVMELINARDLAALLRSDGPMEPARAAGIGLQLLDALDAAHEAGVLHRDVKPANVLIDTTDRTVLTDFGVASVTGDTSLTRTGQLVGSPAYLAPERLTGGTVGPASDLWSLGCTLYAAVEGRPPFHRPEQFAIIAAITVEPVPQPRRAGLLGPVLYGLLEKDQADRWDSAQTRAALEQVAEGLPAVPNAGWGTPSASMTATGDRTVSTDATVPADVERAGAGVGAAAGGPRSTSPGGDAGGAPTQLAGSPVSAAPRTGGETRSDGAAPRPPSGATAPVDLPAAAPSRRRTRHGALLATGLTAILLGGLLAAGSAFYLQNADRDTTDPAPGAASPSASAPPAAGTEEYAHPTLGFRLRVPANWSNRYIPETQTTRFNVLSGAGRTDSKLINATNNLYVYVQPAGGQDAVALAETENRRWAADPKFVNYKTLRLGAASMGSHQGSILEFTYDNELTGPRHILVFRTVVNDTSYEVSLNGPANLFDNDLGIFDDAVDSLVITATPEPTPSPST